MKTLTQSGVAMLNSILGIIGKGIQEVETMSIIVYQVGITFHSIWWISNLIFVLSSNNPGGSTLESDSNSAI